MKIQQWAYVTSDLRVIICSKSELGAKQCATRNKGFQVGYISPINNMFIKTAIKSNGIWQDHGF